MNSDTGSGADSGAEERREATGWSTEPYGLALARVRRRLSSRAPLFARERAEARQQLAELLRQPSARRELLVRNCERFLSLPLARLLISESMKRAPVATDEAESLARLAVEVTGRLDDEVYGRGLLADTLALAWGQIADCLRRTGDLAGAETALDRAYEHVRRGSGECQVTARLLVVEATIRQREACFEEGERLLHRAVRLCRSAGDELHHGLTLGRQASLVRDAGDYRRARWLVREALRHLGAGSLPAQHVEAKLLLVDCEIELGNVETASALLAECAMEVEELAHLPLELRHRWLEGRVASELERYALAEEAFESAREGFEDLGREGQAALVSLDLAVLYRRCGRDARATEVISRVLPYLSRRAKSSELSVAGRRLLETAVLDPTP